MYAIIETGGKQYRVFPGYQVKIEKLAATPGEMVYFDKVLAIINDGNVNVGDPHVKGGSVSAKIVTHGRCDKIKILKFRRRKHHMKRQGHRQHFTEVKVVDIKA